MWPFSRICASKVRLVGRTVVITGANTGIGKETARDLYRRGARIVLACRDIAKGQAAAEDIRNNPPSKPNREQFQGDPGVVVVCKLDLSSFASIRECAKGLIETEANIHILINNAGVMMCPFEKTENNFEMQFQSNYLGHFLFTMLLLPHIKNSMPGCRIVNVSSDAHYFGDIHFDDINLEKSYAPFKAYAQSKLANVLFTKQLALRLKESNLTPGITTYSLHPGVISTELGRHLDSAVFRGARAIYRTVSKPFIKTPELGAQTTIHCAVDEEAGKQSGLFYKECTVTTPSAKARNDNYAVRLWNESTNWIASQCDERFEENIFSPHLQKSQIRGQN